MFDVYLDYVRPHGSPMDVPADWDKFISVLTANDPRLGTTHWSVPGHTGYGYGGKCLPASINHFSSLVMASGTPNFHNISLVTSEYNDVLRSLTEPTEYWHDHILRWNRYWCIGDYRSNLLWDYQAAPMNCWSTLAVWFVYFLVESGYFGQLTYK